MAEVDLSIFDDPSTTKGEKWTWTERLKRIEETFSMPEKDQWRKAFHRDINVLGDLLADVMKYDQAAGDGRPGPRPGADPERSMLRVKQLLDEEFSLLPMPETLANIKGDLSIRGLVAKTGLDFNLIYRLLHGLKEPDIYTMNVLAKTFGKHPSFFLEYRQAFVTVAVNEKMASHPETSIALYKKLRAA